MSCIQFFVSGILSGAAMLIYETPEWSQIIAAWAPVLYAGIMSCGVAYTFQIIGQKGCDPTIASLILSLESVYRFWRDDDSPPESLCQGDHRLCTYVCCHHLPRSTRKAGRRGRILTGKPYPEYFKRCRQFADTFFYISIRTGRTGEPSRSAISLAGLPGNIPPAVPP